MALTAQQLYESILYRAADEWGIDSDDVDRDIGQRFDPLVRFMAGACASELEQIYLHINNSEGRLLERLVRVLLPEHFHLPMPAYALATAQPVSPEELLDETVQFSVDSEEKGKEIAFSPLLTTKVIQAKIVLIATNEMIIDQDRRLVQRRSPKIQEASELRKILIGIECKNPAIEWKGTSFYFDLKGLEGLNSDVAKFYSILSRSKCLVNGTEVKIEPGFPKSEYILEDYLNGNEKLHSHVRAKFERQFFTIQENITQLSNQNLNFNDFIESWLKPYLKDEEVKEQLKKIKSPIKDSLIWFELEFPESILIKQLENRLSISLNVFPVVNRRLCGAANGEHHYLQSTSIKWLHLQPTEDFSSIRRVYEEKSPDFQVFTFKPFSEFKEDKKPSYTIRNGGVGRWDELNAWQRLSYVVGVLQENYAHQELIQKAAGSLSLEDIHHLLGRKILDSSTSRKPTRDIYLLLHSGITSGIRIRVEYWTSIGAEANGINANVSMICSSRHNGSIEPNSIQLITEVTGGKNPLNATEEIDALKSVILTRGRIVTREDVKTYCQEYLGDKINGINLYDGVGADWGNNLGMTRVLEVRLIPSTKYLNEDWDGICEQLKNLLTAKSTSIIPFRVSRVLN